MVQAGLEPATLASLESNICVAVIIRKRISTTLYQLSYWTSYGTVPPYPIYNFTNFLGHRHTWQLGRRVDSIFVAV